jgi:hypothetical protein
VTLSYSEQDKAADGDEVQLELDGLKEAYACLTKDVWDHRAAITKLRVALDQGERSVRNAVVAFLHTSTT